MSQEVKVIKLRRKGNQTIKCGQLTGYNMTITFLEKPCTKCRGKANSRPFYKKSKLAYLWINSLECYTVCFYRMSKSRATKSY